MNSCSFKVIWADTSVINPRLITLLSLSEKLSRILNNLKQYYVVFHLESLLGDMHN